MTTIGDGSKGSSWCRLGASFDQINCLFPRSGTQTHNLISSKALKRVQADKSKFNGVVEANRELKAEVEGLKFEVTWRKAEKEALILRNKGAEQSSKLKQKELLGWELMFSCDLNKSKEKIRSLQDEMADKEEI